MRVANFKFRAIIFAQQQTEKCGSKFKLLKYCFSDNFPTQARSNYQFLCSFLL
jgi:hypothetical protein